MYFQMCSLHRHVLWGRRRQDCRFFFLTIKIKTQVQSQWTGIARDGQLISDLTLFCFSQLNCKNWHTCVSQLQVSCQTIILALWEKFAAAPIPFLTLPRLPSEGCWVLAESRHSLKIRFDICTFRADTFDFGMAYFFLGSFAFQFQPMCTRSG